MEQYIVEYSKYTIVLLMTLYTYECFAVFGRENEKQRNGIYIRQNLLMFLIHLTCYISIILKGGKIEYIFFFAFQQIVLFATIVLFHMLYPLASRLLINNMCMLLSVGFTILTRLSYDKAVKQFLIVTASLAIGLSVPFLMGKFRSFKEWKGFSWACGMTGILALGIVLAAGAVTNGSRLAVSLFGVAFQPSEFVKILFAFCMAGFLSKSQSFRQILFSALVAGIHVLLLVFSRDLGSALIFFLAYIVMVYCATGRLWYLLLGLLGGSAASVASYYLFAHVRVRVQAWKDPWSVIDGAGYQITQSLFAIGCGNWFGLGIGQGSPKSIPYVDTDFIFAAIAEELGIIFGVCLILIYISCFIMFLDIALHVKDAFYRHLLTGLSVIYIFQIFLTVGGGSKFIPLTGVTLPFISYGGSSLLSTVLMFSVAEGVSGLEQTARKRRKIREINVTAGIFVAVFLSLSGYLVYYTATNEEELVNNSYNPRQQLLMQQNSRGSIYARDGSVLAQTVIQENGQAKREYPYQELFAHAVGYSTKGRTGVEEQANYYLIQSGLPFAKRAANEAAGIKNPGDCVYTTLDVTLQQKAKDALGMYKGAVIAMNPKTGEILAMYSNPSFDPNTIADHWEETIADEEKGVLVNRAAQGLYPPGSTFKLVTALEYIRENPDTWQNYSYQCTGSLRHGEDTIRCYHGTVHGGVDLGTSFAKSCNTSFANIGLTFDRAQYEKTLQELLFHQELPVAFASKQSNISIGADTSDGDMMQNAIGQGRTQVTPLHMAMLTSAAANEGILMTPYLTDRVVTAEGELVKRFASGEYGRLMSEEEAAILTELMTEVVQSGTGTKLKDASYTAAGKTGSAEYNGVKEDSHAWFTGFAPVEDPEIVITVVIEGAGSGGDFAVPVARRILDAWFEE